MRFVLLAVALLAGGLLWRRRAPAPFPPALTRLLDNPLRRRVLAPARLARELELAPGMPVLEIGPGGGLFTEVLLREEPRVRLVCLDVQPAMLRQVRRRTEGRSPALVCATASALPFRDGRFARILLVNVLGEVPHRAGALGECARVLAPDGWAAVTESLPDPDYVRPRVLVREAAAAGLRATGRRGTWASYTQRLARASGPGP